MAIVVQPLNHVYKIKIGEVVIYCKQLSYRVRSMIGAQFIKQNSGTEVQDMVGLLFEVLRHSIVDVEGFENPDGTEFKLEFENKVLKEDCLDKLMYVDRVGDVMQLIASGFLNMKTPETIAETNASEFMYDVTVEKQDSIKKKQ